jgi:hypothetical protein
LRPVLTSLWLVASLLAVAACDPAAEDATERPVASATDTSIDGLDPPGEPGSAGGTRPAGVPTAGASSTRDAASLSESTPFPDLDGESVLRTYDLWIVNRLRVDLFVYASAGAGRVTLDTVPGRDSVRLNVQVRARSLRLDAETEDGRAIRSTTLELASASSNRWEIGESGGVE